MFVENIAVLSGSKLGHSLLDMCSSVCSVVIFSALHVGSQSRLLS